MRPDSCIEEVNGEWFVCVDSSSIDEPITYSAGEIVNGGVYGPFNSQSSALSWLREYDSTSTATSAR